jgi:Tol biopolymer transport system component
MRARLLSSLTLLVAFAAVLATTSSATFSGSNGRISFARYVPETNSLEIFSAGSTGSGVTQLTTSGQDHSSIFSDWSPDGNTIAFDSDRPGDGSGLAQIWTMNWDGSGQTQLTTGPGFHGDPSWFPGGTQLAIESDWGNYPALEGVWLIPASDGNGVTQSEATRVTTTPSSAMFDEEPQVSPTGQWIAFTRVKRCSDMQHGRLAGFAHGCISAIFVVHPDGTGLQQLTSWGLNADEPDWSPSGQKIVFDSCDSGRPGCKGAIWVMNADGSGMQRVVDSPPAGDVGHNFANFRFDYRNNPTWSPDGTKIMYTHWENGTQLVTINPDGSGESTVVGGDAFQNWADWGTHP